MSDFKQLLPVTSYIGNQRAFMAQYPGVNPVTAITQDILTAISSHVLLLTDILDMYDNIGALFYCTSKWDAGEGRWYTKE